MRPIIRGSDVWPSGSPGRLHMVLRACLTKSPAACPTIGIPKFFDIPAEHFTLCLAFTVHDDLQKWDEDVGWHVDTLELGIAFYV